MGFGVSSHVAANFTLGLQPYRDRVINTVQFGGTEIAAGRIMAIGRGDMLFAISLPRYATDTVQLVRFARNQGAHISIVTDSFAAPIARYADDLLLAPAVHPVLSSSSVAAVAIVEALLAEFMLCDPAHVERAEKFQQVLVGDRFVLED
jgi:DNA-binding MurR/RpiR family transcriptional regulator